MRWTAQAGALADAISMASTLLRTGKSNPHAIIRAFDHGVALTTTVSAIGTITIPVAATVTEPGEAALSADKLGALAAGFPVWFTEGFRTLDLKKAKTLLDELA